MPHSFLHVSAVSHVRAYQFVVTFSNGSEREVDLAHELYGPVFEPLTDPALFAQVFVDPETRTVAWPNGADLAPEFLFEIGRVVEKSSVR